MRSIVGGCPRPLFPIWGLLAVFWALSGPGLATEYFAGPFASWLNVKSSPYNATGNGTTDDTAAIQDAINVTNASHSVVYLPPGTYKISAPLTIQNQLGFTFVGDDPSTTKIVWGGATGGTMMQVLSTAFANWGRITWEGSSGGVSGVGAAIGIAYTCPGGNCNAGYGPTDLDHFDEVFQNMGKGIAGGQNGAPDNSEMTITRCTFQHCTFAGLSVESYNALDYWVWDSQFLNNREGMTNEVNGGNFMAYRCLFENSTVADLVFNNTGFFSFRNNTSVGSKQFLSGAGASNPAEVSLQGNKVLDTTNAVAIQMFNVGPLILVDNQIRSASGNTGPCVNMSCNGVPSGGDLISIGNVYSVSSPITIVDTTSVTVAGYAAPRMWTQEDVDGAATITSTLPVMPPTATHLTTNITDLPVGSSAASIQNAVNLTVPLAGNHPVIHFPAGTYALNQTVTIPANLDLLMVGDNLKTGVKLTGVGPIFKLAGPSKATIRDMGLNGSSSDGIQVLGADQAGSRVFAEGLYMDTDRTGDVLADTLTNTHVDLQGIQPSRAGLVSVQSTGMGSPSSSRLAIFGGAAGTTGGVAPTSGWMYEVGNGGRMMVNDAWYESGSSPQIVNLTNPDSGVFGFWTGTLGQGSGGTVAVGPPIMVNGFNGQASFLDLNMALSAGSTVIVTNETSQTQALFLGLDGGPGPNFFTRTGSGGTVVFENNKNGGTQVPDQGDARTSAFIDNQLDLFRNPNDQEVPLTTDMPAGVTDARLYRLTFTNCGLALHVSSGVTVVPTNTPNPIPPTATPTAQPTPMAAYTYPQPAQSQLNIAYPSLTTQQVRINAYAFSGQEVASVLANAQAGNSNLATLPVQSFATGVYFYVIHGLGSGKVEAKGKFLVTH